MSAPDPWSPWRLLPPLAIGLGCLTVAAILLSAGPTLGYDFLAYLGGAQRIREGQPLYDTVRSAGDFGLYYYPPPFAMVLVPLTLLPASQSTWLWLLTSVCSAIAAIALMPVRREVRWAVLLLAVTSWPFLYAVKLGQVGPFLLLLFSLAWRGRDAALGFGLSSAAGALVKIQPLLLLGWAIARRRWQAVAVAVGSLAAVVLASVVILGPTVWRDYLSLLGRVAAPITTPHNFTPGAVAYQLGASAEAASALQWATTALVIFVLLGGWALADEEASLVATVVGSQLLSPILWDHYAVVLLLPVAFLLDRRQWWAAAIPLACWLPAPVYPVLFWVCLVAPLAVAGRRKPLASRAIAAHALS